MEGVILKVSNKKLEVNVMPKVRVDKKEDLERALKQLKARCKKEGIFKECKERRHYVKPSVKKRAERKSSKKLM